jgi:hypothetical protein
MCQAQRRRLHAFVVFAVAALLMGGGSAAIAAAKNNLVFQGDASFNGPHGGQAIAVAVVRADDGKVVAKQSGTVSKTANPAFSFTFTGVLENGKAYEVDYWIDSNFGGGSKGACDSRKHDHQWRVELGTVSGNVTHTEKHRPAETADVCDVFK